MPEEIVRGRSLGEIREAWANKLGLASSALRLETLEKPGLLSRQWKVRVAWDESASAESPLGSASLPVGAEKSSPPRHIAAAVREEGFYRIHCPERVEQFIPFPRGGTLFYKGEERETPFTVEAGNDVEFYPCVEGGQLTWQINIRFQGLEAVAKVAKRRPGKYALPETIPYETTLSIEEHAFWEEGLLAGEYWDKEHLAEDLRELKIVYGIREEAWSEILTAADGEEVVAAKAKAPVPGRPPRLAELPDRNQVMAEERDRIDFFASKIELVPEGAVLARKIQGVPGEPGTNIFGRIIPAEVWKDFQFRLKQNVRLSEDGLEVLATCPGRPVKFDNYAYGVDNVYVLNQDVDLESGSIEFPGDVVINGSVQDGLRVVAKGRVEISGGVSHAEIWAEKGLSVKRPVYGGRIIVGEKYVFHSGLLRRLQELQGDLRESLRQTAELVAAAGAARLKSGQSLKLILERNFAKLPKKMAETESYLLGHKDELVTKEFMDSIHTGKRFLTGLGPLDPQSVPALVKVEEVLARIAAGMALEVPEHLKCSVEYIQGTTVACGGDFFCTKGAYNAQLQVDGDIEMQGVCRGGRVLAGGNVFIRELGGSEVSSTLVQIKGTKRLRVDYCHPNVLVTVNKEIIRIEEACRNLEIFRADGRVQVEKLRAGAWPGIRDRIEPGSSTPPF
ncbi:hypothetical protein CEB3_c32620 [Peptococcaceae bacterium CEB3]|nr:hypothetical protein CEB3_c32620 [Peptococcaceae bacterium CEB3]